MKHYLITYLLLFLFSLLIISCNEKKEVRFRADYFMGIEALKITVKDNLKNVLFSTIVDSRDNINVSIDSVIRYSRQADSLKITVNDADTSIAIQDLSKRLIDIAYTNMFYGIKYTVLFGSEYERIIFNQPYFKYYE
ncbi:hypothetical protein [Sphingobacterium sp. xlx-130]|uniref:hypothetical protein n=1 Tax=Sphingobacterium sp. xlx-130 TaxID=2654323 RepID=UPI0013DD8675|nr:hypothetical protein [Sphingobacterium sp. xlx-130]